MLPRKNPAIYFRIALVLVILCTLFLLTGFQGMAVLPDNCTLYHTVWWGDNLFRIGLRYGTTWQTLMTINGLTSTRIYPGQVLCVRTSPTPTPSCSVTYTVVRGDNLFRIGLRYGVSWIVLMFRNHIWNPNLIYPGQVLCIFP